MESEEVMALVSGRVNQEILARNEYLAAENEILRSKLDRVTLSNAERVRLARIGKRIGRKALKDVANIVKPDTILAWHRKLIARKFDGTAQRGKSPGRPPVDAETERQILSMATENPTWGYDRISGALQNIDIQISDQAVGDILRRNGIPPVHSRKGKTDWRDFIDRHMDVMAATDFFTVEVLTSGGLITYYVLFFIHLQSRKIHIAGATPNPDDPWMRQVARNVTMADLGFLNDRRYLIQARLLGRAPATHASYDRKLVCLIRILANDNRL